jgi:hypothetical protein
LPHGSDLARKAEIVGLICISWGCPAGTSQ